MKDEKMKELNAENLEEVNGGMSVTEIRYSLTDDEIMKLIDKGYSVKGVGGVRTNITRQNNNWGGSVTFTAIGAPTAATEFNVKKGEDIMGPLQDLV